jgi:hypothetical protein
MYKTYIKNNSTSSAIIIFLVIFAIFMYIKPTFLFTDYGSIRHFGLGKRNCTILPIWLFVIIAAITAYLLILCYLR